MSEFVLTDGKVVPSHWKMAGEMPMVPQGFSGDGEGFFLSFRFFKNWDPRDHGSGKEVALQNS